MDEQEITEHRYRFFTEKGISIALEQDRVFITLYTAIIAGLTALVVYDKVGYWSSAFFLLAIALSVLGRGGMFNVLGAMLASRSRASMRGFGSLFALRMLTVQSTRSLHITIKCN